MRDRSGRTHTIKSTVQAIKKIKKAFYQSKRSLKSKSIEIEEARSR